MKNIYKKRREVLMNHALQNDMAAYIVFGYGSALGAATQTHGQLRFLTGWDSFEGYSFLIITPKAEYLLLSSPFLLPMALQMQPISAPVTHIVFVQPHEISTYLQKHLPSNRSKIGIVGLSEMPYFLSQTLLTCFSDHSLISLDTELHSQRLIKDSVQINQHRYAASICDHLFSELPKILHKALKAHQSVAYCQIQLAALAQSFGAEFCRTWLVIQAIADYPRYYPIENIHCPKKGDQVLLGIMLMVDGHWGHGIRMGGLGNWQQQSAAQKTLFRSVEALYQQSLSHFRAGNCANIIENVITEELNARYSPEILQTSTRFRSAHGLGYSYEEAISTEPFPQHFGNTISHHDSSQHDENSLYFQNGMLFELHPNLFLPNIGGAAIGNMLLISNNGPEVLLTTPIDWKNYLVA